MIGQKYLLDYVARLNQSGMPRFIILCGLKNSGRKVMAKEIANIIGARLVTSNLGVDSIREVIKLSYQQTEATLYLIPDADKMSQNAKNSLLKITEEPPQKAYFVITLEDINNTLPTLKSRATVLNIDPYMPDEIIEYAKLKGLSLSKQEQEIAQNICVVPGDINTLAQYNIVEFYKYLLTVVEHIGDVNGANAFKIGGKLKYKDADQGWDITLFMRGVMYIYRQKMDEQPLKHYKERIRITSKYLNQILSITGIHKPSAIDMWILEMRGQNGIEI